MKRNRFLGQDGIEPTSLVRSEMVGAIFMLTLDRPAKLNALTLDMVVSLRQLLLDVPSEARSVVIIGSGRAFCAGADLNLLSRPALNENRVFLQVLNEMLLAVRLCSVPVVAALNGLAVGGGAELAGQADFRIFGRSARIQYPDVAIGSTPATVQRLVRCVGEARARRMVLLGEWLTAEEALSCGYAHDLVDDADVMSRALALAADLALLPPMSIALTRKAIELSYQVSADVELAMTVETMALCFADGTQSRLVRDLIAGSGQPLPDSKPMTECHKSH